MRGNFNSLKNLPGQMFINKGDPSWTPVGGLKGPFG